MYPTGSIAGFNIIWWRVANGPFCVPLADSEKKLENSFSRKNNCDITIDDKEAGTELDQA